MKKFIAILLSAVICGVVAFCFCKLVLEKHYLVHGTIMVTLGDEINYLTDSDTAASISILTTVEDLLLSDDEIYEQLSEELGGEYSADELKGCVSIVRREDNKLYYDIIFKMSDKETASKAINIFLELAPERIASFIPNTYTRIVARSEASNENTIWCTAAAAVVGAIIAYIVVCVIRKDTAKTCRKN